MDKKLLARYVFREVVSLLGLALVLFWSAGELRWLAGWAVVALNAFWLAGIGAVILRSNPELVQERMGARRGDRRWDVLLLSLNNLATLTLYIVAGLDRRYGWSGSFPPAAQLVAALVCFLGFALFIRAMAANKFFSQIVRIQTERGHSVAAGGPYRLVRHPGYLGAILYALAAPVLLDSSWALIPGIASALLLLRRTSLEDRVLLQELAGYADYAGTVRYRLLPGIW